MIFVIRNHSLRHLNIHCIKVENKLFSSSFPSFFTKRNQSEKRTESTHFPSIFLLSKRRKNEKLKEFYLPHFPPELLSLFKNIKKKEWKSIRFLLRFPFSNPQKENEGEKKRKEVFFIQLPLLFQKRNKKENPQTVGGQFEGKQKKRSAFGKPRHVSEKTEIRRRIIRRIYYLSPISVFLSNYKYERKLKVVIYGFFLKWGTAKNFV